MIPYSRQDISEADIRAVERVLRSTHLTQGKAIVAFEDAVKKYTGATHAVALSSGTAALHAAYFAAGLSKGDEVLVPAITFAATANAALYLGAVPVFVDVDPRTGLIDLDDARKKITSKTKVVVGVDYAGRPASLRELCAFAKKHALVFIEDGAQSFGATYNGSSLGTQADMTMFSFHPVKSITTGEGGVITTDNAEYAERIRMFRTHGITKEVSAFQNDTHGPWYHEMQLLGYHYRMTDIQAALGESQLKRLPTFIKKRRSIAKRYTTLLKMMPGVILPPEEIVHEESAWHLYALQIEDHTKRRKIFEALHKAGIGAQVHYVPVYWHPFYQSLGYKKGLCPNAELFYSREISIPLFPGLTKAEQAHIVQVLNQALV